MAINANYELVSIWDVAQAPEPYQTVAAALSEYAKSLAVSNAFLTHMPTIGTDHNYDSENPDIRWDHFHIRIPQSAVVSKSSVGESLSECSNSRSVFERALKEISPDAVDTVLDIIAQGSLYKGDEYRRTVEDFERHRNYYNDKLETDSQRQNYAWKHASESSSVSHIRNSSIGTLLVDLSEGMELERAVSRYEKITAPTNYKRPTALVTPAMIEKAKQTVSDLGLEDSMDRRFATYTDLSANDMLFVDRDTPLAKDAFDALSEEVKARPGKSLERTDEIGIDDFIANVLPHITGMELLVENRHQPNLMSLTASRNGTDETKLFKWDNGFAWTYVGDVADSLKQKVKNAGGRVDGYMRVSLGWENSDDLDIHVWEPEGSHIYYSNMGSAHTGAALDVDANANRVVKNPVENIVWVDPKKMLDGTYKVAVHNFNQRTTESPGFEVELEFMGQTWNWASDRSPGGSQYIDICEFTVDGSMGRISVKDLIPSSKASWEVWGIETEKFQPVSLMLASPNHWGASSVGNKHWMFILKNCKNPESARGFYNEYLRADLDKHRKVFEMLGNRLRVEPSDDQLSGVGFSTTQRNSVMCRVSGSFSRTLKINF